MLGSFPGLSGSLISGDRLTLAAFCRTPYPMASFRKHVILLCHDPARAQSAHQLLEGVPVCAVVETAVDLSHLRQLLSIRIPDVIIIHPDPGASRSMHYIKDLRKDIYIDGIPVFLYPVLPDAQELFQILTRLHP
jgi:hypothetical protein